MTESGHKTYEGSELDRDPYEGFRLPECPACDQSHAPPYVGGLCIECGRTFDIAEVAVTWESKP